jgi:hypothetical protein
VHPPAFKSTLPTSRVLESNDTLDGRGSVRECIVLGIPELPRVEPGEKHSLKDRTRVKFRKECIKFAHVGIPQLIGLLAGALNDVFSILIRAEAMWATISVTLLPMEHVLVGRKVTCGMFDELPFEPGAHSLHGSFKGIPVNVGRLEGTQPVASRPKFQDGSTSAVMINVLCQVFGDEFTIEDNIPGGAVDCMLRGIAIQQTVLLLQIRSRRVVHINVFLGPIIQGAIARAGLGS